MSDLIYYILVAYAAVGLTFGTVVVAIVRRSPEIRAHWGWKDYALTALCFLLWPVAAISIAMSDSA